MMRILLFLGTNIAVLLVASITLRLLGVEGYLRGQGINFTSLLIFCFIFGMAGSIISLFISKWMAKRTTGLHLITEPRGLEQRRCAGGRLGRPTQPHAPRRSARGSGSRNWTRR